MPAVVCDYTGCIHNIACECTRPGEIRISEGCCMDSEDGQTTGEIIEESEVENIGDRCKTCIHDDDELSEECYNCTKGIIDCYVRK